MGCHVKCPLLSYLNQTRIFWTYFEKNKILKYQINLMKIHALGAELFHAGDSRIDTTKLTVACLQLCERS